MNTKNIKRLAKGVMLFAATLFTTTSCSDFFDVDSTHVIDADKTRLNNATDSIYSMTGILNKLQAIGDRTILLGEARGDLMDVTSYTNSDLRDVAMFQIGDDNKYNSPADYYAVINNCNYFIAHADTALKNNRNENIFMAEYAAVKAIRAWTYLQLVTTYGKVPFYTTPILSEEEANRDYPMMDIKGVCDYFINQDGLDKLVDQDYPHYGVIKSMPSRLFYFPMRLVLGDLNLWAGNYLDAAKYYHDYIINRNGENSIYPTTTSSVIWASNTWKLRSDSWTTNTFPGTESNAANSEVISIIPTDSIPSEGYYSELRGIFNTAYNDDYKVSLVPSKQISDISAAQKYCFLNSEGEIEYAPTGLEGNYTGDLRLSRAYTKMDDVTLNDEKIDYQSINKYNSRNIRVYRRTLVYLRLAEAVNRAGYPHYAFQILSSGVNDKILKDSVCKYYTKEDSTLLVNTLNFRGSNISSYNTTYVVNTDPKATTNYNTQGIHSRGCGFTPANEYYRMPQGTIQEQIKAVEDLIVNEEALEFAFEGYRYYDLLRVALRRTDNPNYLSDIIKSRRGAGNDSGITVDLTNPYNWFLHYKGKIGY